MTTEEFSNEFDVLLDSYRRFKSLDSKEELDSIEFNEYEKSIFLTKAQENIILEYYTGKNPYNESFEKTEEIRRLLNNLIKTYSTSASLDSYNGLSSNSLFYKLPKDLWFVTYESVIIKDELFNNNTDSYLSVVPITQDDYYKTINNPFKNTNDKRVLKLDIEDNVVEIISKYKVSKYIVRYISKPSPIILLDLPDDITINGINTKTECLLNEFIHKEIINRAVQLAIMSKIPNNTNS